MYQGKYLANPKTAKAPRQKAPKQRRRATLGTVIFYALYFIFIGAAIFGIRYGLTVVDDFLVRFEASQPDAKGQELFDSLFADPDWAELYVMAGLEDTEFEGKDAFAAYMEEKVGGQKLEASMTSAGLTGGQKYIIKLGDEKIATFSMQNHATGELEIPQWELSGIELFYTRRADVTVNTMAGRTVLLAGVPLDGDYIVRTTASLVENYLPEGVTAPRTATYYASGFLTVPEVLVLDAEGQPVPLVYDAETNTYSEEAVTAGFAEIGDAERSAMVDATKAYCRYMIGASGSSLRNYFNTSSAIYKSITGNELWFRGYTSYNFTDATVTEYCPYNDNLFSARIELTLNVYRADGSVKPFPINTTLFMEKNSKGKWIVNNMTNVDVHEIRTMVRLTLLVDGQIISDGLIDAGLDKLVLPQVTVPEGMEFIGWFKETTDEDGNVTLSRVFAPSESNTVTLPSDYELEPMVLQARFQKQGA